MEQRILGKTDLPVSVLGFGGSEIGFTPGIDQALVNKLVTSAIECGVNFFDTAAAYLQSEVLLGQALIDYRRDIFISSKCGAINGFAQSDWSKNGILASIERSLKSLQTDYLDLALLHSCGELEFLWAEAAEGLRIARDKGLVRFIGYSGDNAQAVIASLSGIFDILETSINIADQQVLETGLVLARENSLGVIAKRPLANAAWRYLSRPDNDYHFEYWRRLKELDFLFLKDGSLAAEIALRFTLSQPGVCTAIVGTTNPNRFQENAAAVEKGALLATDLEEIRKRWQDVAKPYWVGQL